ncbi:uncharacterized protein KGF55_003510 [Candida pseudojiufengensis]|uniref:uncharacterized protein n=1 Tax=Candida pseudojiufengensis TaxID=497109 RepID=UPI00222548D8|nr:uncharacterized protein KGF55_003510 [Candida pseudojiufengensis]KAI5962434.1 hypothetical protein KGF55_003510 [Candida pseudojiufengensis]
MAETGINEKSHFPLHEKAEASDLNNQVENIVTKPDESYQNSTACLSQNLEDQPLKSLPDLNQENAVNTHNAESQERPMTQESRQTLTNEATDHAPIDITVANDILEKETEDVEVDNRSEEKPEEDSAKLMEIDEGGDTVEEKKSEASVKQMPAETVDDKKEPEETLDDKKDIEDSNELGASTLSNLPEIDATEKLEAFSDDDINVDDISSEENENDESSQSESESDSNTSTDEEMSDTDTNHANEDIGDDEEGETNEGPIKSANEINEKAPTLPENYQIPNNSPIEEIGTITGLVDNSVLITAKYSGEFRILKEESIFCFDDRTVIGPLFEIFGRVQQPIYSVKFNSPEEFAKFKDSKGKTVFYVVSDSQFLYTDSIKYLKGTDASNCHDEEIPEEEQEFSDDEQEQAAKQAKKKRKNKQNKGARDNANNDNKGKKVHKPNENHITAHRAHIPSYSPISQTYHPRNQNNYQLPQIPIQSYQSPPQPSAYGVPYNPNQHNFNHAPQQPSGYRPYGQAMPYQVPQQYPQQYGALQQNQPSPYGQYSNPQSQYQQQQEQQLPYQSIPQPQHGAPTSNQNVDPAQLAHLQRLLLQQLQNQANQQNQSFQ